MTNPFEAVVVRGAEEVHELCRVVLGIEVDLNRPRTRSVQVQTGQAEREETHLQVAVVEGEMRVLVEESVEVHVEVSTVILQLRNDPGNLRVRLNPVSVKIARCQTGSKGTGGAAERTGIECV